MNFFSCSREFTGIIILFFGQSLIFMLSYEIVSTPVAYLWFFISLDFLSFMFNSNIVSVHPYETLASTFDNFCS